MKKLSNEEAQNVLDNAPEGFAHYCENTGGDIFYFNPDNLNAYIPWTSDCIELGSCHYANSRSKPLSDLRDQLNQHEWSGEGLPPVGVECKMKRTHPPRNGEPGFIEGPNAGEEVYICSHFTNRRGVELAAYCGVFKDIGGVAAGIAFEKTESEEEKAAVERQARIKHWRDMHSRLAREDFFAYLADNVEVE